MLIHDSWALSDRFTQATHQQCVAQVLRRARELLKVARGEAAKFPCELTLATLRDCNGRFDDSFTAAYYFSSCHIDRRTQLLSQVSTADSKLRRKGRDIVRQGVEHSRHPRDSGKLVRLAAYHSVATDLKEIDSAAKVAEAEQALENFAQAWDENSLTISKNWRTEWLDVVALLDFAVVPMSQCRSTERSRRPTRSNRSSVIRKLTRNQKI